VGIQVCDDYRGLSVWSGPMVVKLLDGREFRLPAGTVIGLFEHVISWSWAGDEPGGIVIPHSNVASVEQIPDGDDGEAPAARGPSGGGASQSATSSRARAAK